MGPFATLGTSTVVGMTVATVDPVLNRGACDIRIWQRISRFPHRSRRVGQRSDGVLLGRNSSTGQAYRHGQQ